MRILIHSLNFWPEPTATGKYTGEMAFWLAQHGHDVDVICGLPHYPNWQLAEGYSKTFSIEKVDGVTIFRTPHTIPTPGNVTAKARIRMELSFVLSGLRWWIPIMFRRRKYDLVIAVCPPMQTGVMPTVYRLLRRVPWVFHIQDFQVDAALRLKMLNLGRLGSILYRIENFLLGQATAVSSITDAMCRRAVEKCRTIETIIKFPNWSNIKAICPGPSQNSFRESLEIGSDRIIVMYAGAMGDKQGLELIIQAAERLKHVTVLQFVLVGAGANKARLEAAAKEADLQNIRFLPVQPLEILNEMLAASDIQLIVQKREAADLVMPSKLTNILAAGRPAIATAPSGTALADVLVDNQAGLAVEPDDLDAFVSAIESLAQNSDARSKFGANARLYAERMLDQDAIMRRFSQDIESLVK